MQLEVFGDLAVAVYAGAIGGNDRKRHSGQILPFAIEVEGGLNPCAYADNHPLRFADPLELTSNKRGPGLCNGTDCVEPRFDPSSKDQKPLPQPEPKKK